MGRLGKEPILSIKWYVTIQIIKFDGHGDGDGTCKQGLRSSKRSFHMSWEIFDFLQ